MKHRDTKTQSLLLRAIALALRGHKGALKNILKRAFVSLCLCVSVFSPQFSANTNI
jgi:hypothetical protein